TTTESRYLKPNAFKLISTTSTKILLKNKEKSLMRKIKNKMLFHKVTDKNNSVIITLFNLNIFCFNCIK
ncbi:TPA: hypothetical protein ACG1N9_001982, partial [Salmonella enterica subsp. enterica serovar Derby]